MAAKVAGPLGDRVHDYFQPTPEEWNDWRWHFRHRVRRLDQLRAILGPTSFPTSELENVVGTYPLSITPFYLSLATPAAADPILRQSVPAAQELTTSSLGQEDPLQEARDSPVPGLVHRYADRALLVLTDVCPVMCRHCTRKREWRHGAWIRPWRDLERCFAYLRSNPGIRDVIISGGDPLILGNAQLGRILRELRAIPHLDFLRFGTRCPVVLPLRIDEGFCRLCDRYGPIWLNTQFNHPVEITPEAAAAVRRLMSAGVPVNNQAVLLRGVNDSLDVQTELSRRLLKIRVRPYYLYHADEVRGTEHLRTPVDTGLEILEGMRGRVSGLGIPAYVVDLPGGGGKVPLQPDYVLSRSPAWVTVRNHTDQVFTFRNPD